MYVIYALVDPRDNQVRYVGMTNNVYKRFIEHINCSGSNFAKNTWIMELRSLNKMIIMKTLEEVEDSTQALDREAYWINHFETKGSLFNIAHRQPLKKAKKASPRLEQFKIKNVQPDNRVKIGDMFFNRKMSISEIARELFPHVKGGDNYRTVMTIITDAIRIWTELHSQGQETEQDGNTLSERQEQIGKLFFGEQKLNISAIVREVFPEIKGGDAYQKAAAEVADAIRAYSEAMQQA